MSQDTPQTNTADEADEWAEQEPSLWRFWQPRYWLMWLGFGLLRLMVMLPFRLQVSIGRFLGRTIFRLMPRRRRIARANIDLLLPPMVGRRAGPLAA